MLTRTEVAAASVPAATHQYFEQIVNFVANTFDAMAQQLSVPEPEVTVILTDNFIADVERLDPSGLNATYTAERIGGVVAAKNIPLTHDSSRVTIVFASEPWGGDPNESSMARALQFLIVAHEFAHPLLIRARYASGVMNGLNVPARTAADQFRASGRAAWDEHRADLLAYSVLGEVASKTVDGVTSRLEAANLIGPSYLADLVSVLDSIHPAWAQVVQDYREWRLDTPSLWGAIAPKVDQLLTWLAHVEATMRATGKGQLSISNELREHPAMRLYVRDQWTPFADTIRRLPVLPAMDELAAAEVAVMDAGEAAFRGILTQLGLSVYDRPDGSYYIDVREPRR